MSKITYSDVGDNYETKDPIKKKAQEAAKQTSIHLEKLNFKEMQDSRGESAYVWQLPDGTFMASVIEGLGTKNLIADALRKSASQTYYDVIGYDTVATIINDLVSVGAKPFVLNAYWAIEDNSWLSDKERITDLIKGWKEACDFAKITWGGGETPTLKGIITPGTIDLGGSAIGSIESGERRITSEKLQTSDRIILIKSNGINANGVSLARAVAKNLPEGYLSKLPGGASFGEALLTKTNIYANLVSDLLDKGVNIHYISNITGHGMRKIMRAAEDFSYIVEKVFPIPELFSFIQEKAGLSDEEMYGTYNMGQDYAIFLPLESLEKAQSIISKNGFESLNAGYIEKGGRKVVIEPKNITFEASSLDLR